MTIAAETADVVNTVLIVLLFSTGLICLLTQRVAIKQVIGLKIMFLGASLGMIHAGYMSGDVQLAQTMVVSALIVEAVVIAVALALIVNVYHHYASGDVDRLNRLRG